jgi:hypothetical protein
MRYLFAAAFVCLAWQASPVLAYSCNDNHYVNSSGRVVHSPSCVMSPRSILRSAAMAAPAVQSIIVERARITVASPTGIALKDRPLLFSIRLARG